MTRLLTLLRARPDDEELRQVWADELLAAGDPRGEFVALVGHLARDPTIATRLGRLRGIDRDGDPLPAGAIARLGSGGAPVALPTFSGDGRLLAWRRGHDVWVQRLDDDRRVARLPSRGVKALALALDGEHVAIGAAGGVAVWSLARLEPVPLPGVVVAAHALAFGAEGQLVVGSAGTLQRWSVGAGSPEMTLERAIGGTALAVAAGVGWIAVATSQGTFHRWDTDGNTQVMRRMPEIDPVRSAALATDGRRGVFAGSFCVAVIGDAVFQQLADPEGDGWAGAGPVGALDDGAVAGRARGQVLHFDLATDEQRAVDLPGHADTVALSAGGAIAACGRLGIELHSGDGDGGGGRARQLEAHDFHGEVQSLAFGPDGRSLLATADEWCVQRFALDGAPLPAWPIRALCTLISWSPTGDVAALAGQGWLSLRDADGRERHHLAFERQAWAVAWAPSGKQLVVLTSDGAHRVDVATGERELLALDVTTVSSVAFSSDGERLAVADRAALRILDAASLAPLRVIAERTGHAWFVGDQLVTLDGRGRLSTRDDDGATRSFVDFRECAGAFALTTDRRWLALQILDGTVHVFDLASFRTRARMDRADLRALALSPDGELLAIAGFREVLLYPVGAL